MIDTVVLMGEVTKDRLEKKKIPEPCYKSIETLQRGWESPREEADKSFRAGEQLW